MSFRIFEKVVLGKNCVIEENCLIGKPPRGKKEGELKTIIGDNAVIRSGTIIYAGVTIGKNFQSGHNVLIREDNKIGDNVSIGTNSAIEIDNVIGNNVRIHSLCFLEKVRVEDNVFIGPCVAFFDDPHPRIPRGKDCMKGAVVRKSAKIGGGSRILPYVVIGKNALVGAGSVVTKNVEKDMVVIGNPAKKLKKIQEILCTRTGVAHKPYDSIS